MMKMEATDRRFIRRLSNEGRASISLQKMLAETKRVSQNTNDQIPDFTDYKNDMFFEVASDFDRKKAYNINGNCDEYDFDSSTRSVSSRETQEWLEEAKRMVATSPLRGRDSPSRLSGSPRFATFQGRFSTSSLDKRDPFSRSARRRRAAEGFSGEILTKTAMHTRNKSLANLDSPQDTASPASDVQEWAPNVLKIPNSPGHAISPDTTPASPNNNLGAPPLPPRQSTHRRSRFQSEPNTPLSHPIPISTNSPPISLPKRNFKTTSNGNNGPSTTLDTQLLSPPKNLVESAHRRSISSTTCSVPDGGALSPAGNPVESAHRRSISSSTCSTDRILQKDVMDDGKLKDVVFKVQDLNGFLKEQRVKIEKLLSGEINGKAKIVLSGPSNSTSSMVAATCYAWLLENRRRANRKEDGRKDSTLEFVVPVMNIRRGKMWKQRQAAWLFHHVGLDATSLLFSNEVDLETLMMAKQLSILVVGEDILKTNGEVGSGCTILTDNYCEDAYDLLQMPILKRLLLAGILLDTQNLSTSPKLSMARDAEAVQLLSVASAPNYRNTLFDQLIQDQRDNSFFEVLCRTYGKPPSDINWDVGEGKERRSSEKIASNEALVPSDNKKKDGTNDARTKKISPILGKPTPSPVKATPTRANDPSRGKNRNFFAKLFGFGSK